MTHPIEEELFNLLQQCDEIGGPEDKEYIALMVKLSDVTKTRAINAAVHWDQSPPFPPKLQEVPIFHTPKSMNELEQMWANYTNPTEKALVVQGSMFAWNLACHITNKED